MPSSCRYFEIKKTMNKIILNPLVKTTAILMCLFNLNFLVAQRYTMRAPDKVLKPVFVEDGTKPLKYKFGIGFETYTSGNAHGTFYSARVNLSRGKNVFGFGPCLQKRSMQVNGIKLNYSYLLTGINEGYDQDEIGENKKDPHDILELRLLVSLQYISNASLSYKASRVETVTNPESTINYNDMRFSTIEGAVCLELDVDLKWIRIRNYMGASVFNHFNYMNGMYRPKCGPALMFGAGIIIPEFN
jgi:hypothetical protein